MHVMEPNEDSMPVPESHFFHRELATFKPVDSLPANYPTQENAVRPLPFRKEGETVWNLEATYPQCNFFSREET